MPLSRRSTLFLAGGAAVVSAGGYLGWRQVGGSAPTVANQALAQPSPAAPTTPGDDRRKAPRTLGDPAAKVTVTEFFSLTCTHCAAFARETMPAVEKDLIEPKKVRFVYRDFPLDQVALTAAMVARYLPPERYYPFITALLANQDRWAFARGINSTEEIWKMAALAGMARATFDQAVADNDLRTWIVQEQKADQDHWRIDSTPSFVINGQKYAGQMSFDAFRKLIPEA